MPTLPVITCKMFLPLNSIAAAADMDVERARTSSTPDALTVIDPRVSTMGLRGLADGSIVL